MGVDGEGEWRGWVTGEAAELEWSGWHGKLARHANSAMTTCVRLARSDTCRGRQQIRTSEASDRLCTLAS